MRKVKKLLLMTIDILSVPVVFFSAYFLGKIRNIGIENFPLSKSVMFRVGTFPINDHYYEPLFNPKHLYRPLSLDRPLIGIDWNIEEQLELLKKLKFTSEIMNYNITSGDNLNITTNMFGPGDAEYLYNLVRLKRPTRIIEVGCGQSTSIICKAIERNKSDDNTYTCSHICIEPYENEWLSNLDITLVRKKIEDVDRRIFDELESDDLLFIDSSHVIRPQGDVVISILEIIPSLKSGVIVHLHDIYSPRDYIDLFLTDRIYLWNEQYLLEAFLTNNTDWKIIGSLNMLARKQFDELNSICVSLPREKNPGSFYIQRVK